MNRPYLSRVRPDVICKICNKRFKLLTGTHLGTHGLTRDEYLLQYETPPVVEPPMPLAMTEREARGSQILETIADWMMGQNQVNELAQRALANLMNGGREKFKIALMSVALAKVDRMANLITALSQIQKRLLDPAYLASASPAELLEIYKVANTDLHASIGMLERIVEPKDGGRAGMGALHNVFLQYVQAENAGVAAGGADGTEPLRLPKKADARRKMAMLLGRLQAVVHVEEPAVPAV